MKQTFTFLILMLFAVGQAQFQVGQTIYGDGENQRLGTYLDCDDTGNRMIVAAVNFDITHPDDDYVRVYDFDGQAWVQVGPDFTPPYANYHSWGREVSISGDGKTIVITGTEEEKVYIYREFSGSWTLIGELQSSFPGVTDFGYDHSLSADGNTIVVSQTSVNNFRGIVEVYDYDSTQWNQRGLDIHGNNWFDNFGYSVDITSDGNTIVIGAPQLSTSQGDGYFKVFTSSGSNWYQKGYTINGQTFNVEKLGWRIAISDSGNEVLGQSYYPNGNSYLYQYSGSAWLLFNQTIYGGGVEFAAYSAALSGTGNFTIAEHNGEMGFFQYQSNAWYQIGQGIPFLYQSTSPKTRSYAISSDGSRVFIGYDRFDGSEVDMGAVRVFDLTDYCDWNLQVGGEILPNSSQQGEFGKAIDYSDDGNFMIVGAPLGDVNGTNSGSVTIYERQGATWVQRGATIHGQNAYDQFGFSVGISNGGSTIVVGAPLNDSNGTNSGEVRVYKWIGNDYTLFSTPRYGKDVYDRMGYAVAITANGNYFVATSPYNDQQGLNRGKAQVYYVSSYGISNHGNAFYGTVNNDYAGLTVSISDAGTIVSLGAEFADVTGSNSGSVITYKKSGSNWFTYPGLRINGYDAYDYLGSDLDLSANGKVMVVGVKGRDFGGTNRGSASVYSLVGNQWVIVGYPLTGDAAHDNFGAACAISNSGLRIVVSAPYNDDNGPSAGKATIFDYANGQWIQNGSPMVGGTSGDNFGAAVDISGNGTLVLGGSRFNDAAGPNAGKVSVYSTCISNPKNLNSFSFEDIAEDEVDETSDLSVNQKINISVYPNPTSDYINLMGVSQDATIQMYDALGKVVMISHEENNRIDVSHLQTGIYFMVIKDKDIVHSERVLIE